MEWSSLTRQSSLLEQCILVIQGSWSHPLEQLLREYVGLMENGVEKHHHANVSINELWSHYLYAILHVHSTFMYVCTCTYIGNGIIVLYSD